MGALFFTFYADRFVFCHLYHYNFSPFAIAVRFTVFFCPLGNPVARGLDVWRHAGTFVALVSD